MKSKIRPFALAVLLVLIACADRAAAQEIPANLLQAVPQAASSLYSTDPAERIFVLDELVKVQDEKCYVLLKPSTELSSADFGFVIGKIFELDLPRIERKTAARTLWKIGFLLKKYGLSGFAAELAGQLKKFPAGEAQSSPELGIQYEILVTLKALKMKETAPQIAALLNSPQEILRREALSALVEIGAREALPQLVPMLVDSNHLKRFEALQSLARVKDPAAGPQVAELLSDPNFDLRYWTIDTLVKTGAKDQSKEPWKFIESKPDQRLEGYAVAALLQFEDKKALPLAFDHLKTMAQGSEKSGAWEFIYQLKPKIVVQAVIAAYHAKDRFLADDNQEKRYRELLLRSLVHYRSREAIPIFRERLTEKYCCGYGWRANNDMARLLQELDAREAVDDIIRVFNDCLAVGGHQDYRYMAGELALVLAKFGDRRVWRQIIDYVEKNNDYYTRESIINELNRHLDPKLWAALEAGKSTVIPYNTAAAAAEISSRETGVPISFEYAPPKDVNTCRPEETLDPDGMPCTYIAEGTSLLDTVKTIVGALNDRKRGKYAFIFDKGTVRILPVDRAVEWWRTNNLK